ncbi:MAG: hypothetical protein ACO3CR_01615 [Solirubrobacterales bacterium]
MNETVTAEGRLDIGGVFSRTGDIYKQAFGTVWVVALILFVPVIILNALFGDSGWLLGLIVGVIQLIAGVWFAGTMVKVVEDVEADGVVDASVGELLGLVWPRLVSLILLGIVVGVLVTLGLILLIIPGIILTLMWIVSTPAMMVEDKGVFDSMSRSSELTKGNRMRVLGVGLLLIVAYIVIFLVISLLAAISPILGIIAGIALVIAAYPYLAMIASVLYFNLVEVKGGRVVTGGGPTAGIEQPGQVEQVEIVEEVDQGPGGPEDRQ